MRLTLVDVAVESVNLAGPGNVDIRVDETTDIDQPGMTSVEDVEDDATGVEARLLEVPAGNLFACRKVKWPVNSNATHGAVPSL